ncbi:peptide deformylase [Persicobacter psychrovividus]|uniref:Peptide deformylase n=2 Tax=Persicobacter psychrovividus TaxID=387638 RepID=A0ABM7VCT7_9BACT|nr:peptide deformylase [Persicobacter psychrovividus]
MPDTDELKINYNLTKHTQMILPITAYGMPVLKKLAVDIEENNEEVQALVANMFETMYKASGVGLAGPQVNENLRIFVIDGSPMAEEDPKCEGFKKVFINPEIIEEYGEEWGFEEGCLSIPGIRETVMRPEKVLIRYRDENWQEHEEEFDGLRARIVQHEYDHVEGILFTDYLTPFKKRLLKKKLTNIAKGVAPHDYRMKFPK